MNKLHRIYRAYVAMHSLSYAFYWMRKGNREYSYACARDAKIMLMEAWTGKFWQGGKLVKTLL